MLLLSLLTASTPSFTFIGSPSIFSKYKIMVNYNGQADLLLSLQIFPDYYPYQFKQRSLYDYLTNIRKYLVVNEFTSGEKKKLGEKLQFRLNNLINQVKTFGPSLWNEDLYEGGLVHRNDQFWTSKETDYLFLEQFILDDYADPLYLINKLPKHKNLMVTNFRASRDPYTLFGEEVYKFFESINKNQENSKVENNKLAKELNNYYKNYSKLYPNNLYRTSRYINFFNSFNTELKSLLKNGKDNGEESNPFFEVPESNEKIFAPWSKNGEDDGLANLFESLIYSEEEMQELKKWIKNGSENLKENEFHEHVISYLMNKSKEKKPENQICPGSDKSIQQVHHPALEHQTIKGSSPTSEGTQKDLMVYLAQLAVLLKKISSMDSFSRDFNLDSRKEFIENAWDNSKTIAKNYKERLKKIRDYLKAAKIVDSSFDPEKKCFNRENSKTLAVISYPPSQLGAGNSAIQTISKYSFLYKELGLKEVFPVTEKIEKEKGNHNSHHEINEDILGLDDNGWWWRLGDSNFSENGFFRFKSSVDSIIFLATQDDWNVLNSLDNPKLNSLKELMRNQNGKTVNLSHNSFHLWNEGLRSPLALNLLLDSVVEILTQQFAVNLRNNQNGIQVEGEDGESLSQKYKDALDWGSYWSSQFIESKAKISG